jgi:hypothetical protein
MLSTHLVVGRLHQLIDKLLLHSLVRLSRDHVADSLIERMRL